VWDWPENRLEAAVTAETLTEMHWAVITVAFTKATLAEAVLTLELGFSNVPGSLLKASGS
jgi:hypothetical protein